MAVLASSGVESFPESCPDAVEVAVVAHRPALLQYAQRLCRDEALAEDLVQEAVLRALERRAQFSARGPVDAWLRSILRNVFRMRVRDTRERPEPIDDQADDCSAEDAALDNITRQELRSWLHGVLGPSDQSIVNLYYGRELSVSEIALRLQTSTSAVKCRLYRIRRRVEAVAPRIA
jgi:RNA polymerase sigma-70 factor (ECF subfamily)